MSDPAIEAAIRTARHYRIPVRPTVYEIHAAREALKPIRVEFIYLREHANDLIEDGSPSEAATGAGILKALESIAPLIYTTGELNQ